MAPRRPRLNDFGQPIGPVLDGWRSPPAPQREVLEGRWCRLEPLDPASHADELLEANAEDDGRMWTYLPYGPFESPADYRAWLEETARVADPLLFAIRDLGSGASGSPGPVGGIAGYLRIHPDLGSIEVGHLAYAPRLQRTRAGTEAMYLLMRRAFDLGYRRYEWKCDALNEPSLRAARRYGFVDEGTFRQAQVYKGRSRDTAWLSIVDGEWPFIRAGFEAWLAPSNFDAEGRQLRSLAACRGAR